MNLYAQVKNIIYWNLRKTYLILSILLPIYPHICHFTYLSIYPSTYQPMYPFQSWTIGIFNPQFSFSWARSFKRESRHQGFSPICHLAVLTCLVCMYVGKKASLTVCSFFYEITVWNDGRAASSTLRKSSELRIGEICKKVQLKADRVWRTRKWARMWEA